MTTPASNRSVALLRGVNVGGITVKSAAVFRNLGFTDVTTVLASGNVLFSPTDTIDVKRSIEGALSDAFGYDAWIVLADQIAIRAVVDSFPFDETVDRQPYVVFASDRRSIDELLAFADAGLDDDVERVAPGDGVLYWEVVRGETVKSAFGRELKKRGYRETTTTRNLRTLRKLI